jgi:prepilin-type N-terminal cleavage/methylation domain-containing protein/prepilin-type processing-associated H-X9-DG protein
MSCFAPPASCQARGCRTNGKASRGFTLIEILVVVAIIALLISILLPSLARARNQTKLVACRANLHDLANASNMYAESYRNFFPITPNAGEDTFYSLWKARLLKNPNVVIDPATKNVIRPESLKFPEVSDPSKLKEDIDGVNIPYAAIIGTKKANGDDNTNDLQDNAKFGKEDGAGGHSYEYNGCYDESSGSPLWSGKHKKTVHYRFFLAQLVLVHDNDDAGSGFGPKGCEVSRHGNGNNCPQPWDNHGAEGMNMMFADGHADYIKKIGGNWTEYNGTSPTTKFSQNASIDKVLVRSQKPWEYFK